MGARNAVFACFLVGLAFLVCLYRIVGASELPQLKLDASPVMAFAPADVHVIVIAKPDERNRHLAVAIGANDSLYSSSSQQTLRGEEERGQLAEKTYRNVPPGTYLVVAALYDQDGKMLARASKEVRRISRVE